MIDSHNFIVAKLLPLQIVVAVVKILNRIVKANTSSISWSHVNSGYFSNPFGRLLNRFCRHAKSLRAKHFNVIQSDSTNRREEELVTVEGGGSVPKEIVKVECHIEKKN